MMDSQQRQFKVSVIGVGYVGLPLCAAAAGAGLTVVGLDASDAVVTGLNAGRSHVDDVSDDDVAAMLQSGFHASNDMSEISDSDVIVICVPTPLAEGGLPDLSAVLAAGRSVREHLSLGSTVVLESTTYPGTTADVLRPLIEESGKRAGEDFFLAFSPERVDPGNPHFGITNTPKVVGGITPECAERAQNFYSCFVKEVVMAKGTREAETSKLLENTYRHINIALVNEMARVCHELDLDFWDVVRCASTKPFGFQRFEPGPGVGGHCIPIDPNYLSSAVKAKLGYPLRFVELAEEINRSMPHYVTRRAQDILNGGRKAVRGSRIALVGVTYKPDIADERESPAVPVAERLLRLGAELTYWDPHVPSWSVLGCEVPPSDPRPPVAYDLGIILQHHRMVDVGSVLDACELVFDTRGRIAGSNVERL